jgi:hypothetical protein
VEFESESEAPNNRKSVSVKVKRRARLVCGVKQGLWKGIKVSFLATLLLRVSSFFDTKKRKITGRFI